MGSPARARPGGYPAPARFGCAGPLEAGARRPRASKQCWTSEGSRVETRGRHVETGHGSARPAAACWARARSSRSPTRSSRSTDSPSRVGIFSMAARRPSYGWAKPRARAPTIGRSGSRSRSRRSSTIRPLPCATRTSASARTWRWSCRPRSRIPSSSSVRRPGASSSGPTSGWDGAGASSSSASSPPSISCSWRSRESARSCRSPPRWRCCSRRSSSSGASIPVSRVERRARRGRCTPARVRDAAAGRSGSPASASAGARARSR